MVGIVFKETLRGESLGRTLQNIALSRIKLTGVGVDLGSKTSNASYYRFLQRDTETKIVFTDLYVRTEELMAVDLEQVFPFADDSQDFLLLNNTLEHLFNYQHCINECHRVLKREGRLIGVVPFLYQIHFDPDDFFRYTISALRRIFTEAGFDSIAIRPLGFGPFTAAAAQYAPCFKWKPLVALCYIVAIGIDKVFNLLFPNSNRVKSDRFPLGYFFECTK